MCSESKMILSLTENNYNERTGKMDYAKYHYIALEKKVMNEFMKFTGNNSFSIALE